MCDYCLADPRYSVLYTEKLAAKAQLARLQLNPTRHKTTAKSNQKFLLQQYHATSKQLMELHAQLAEQRAVKIKRSNWLNK